jgi:hypothetical protein
MTDGMRRMQRAALALLAAVAAAPVVVACSKEKPPETAQSFNTGTCPPGSPPGYPGCPPGGSPIATGATSTGTYPYPTASTVPGATASAAPTDSNNPFGAIIGGIASAMQPGGLSGDLAETGLKTQATRKAPNMQPEGQLTKQGVTEGQHVSVMIPMQAGKCYTILGYSPTGQVSDVGLTLYGPPLYNVAAGQSSGTTNAPAIGASPNPMCPVVPFPVQYKLDVVARKGAGQIAVQVYSKTK